jgi:hypothetical protein
MTFSASDKIGAYEVVSRIGVGEWGEEIAKRFQNEPSPMK